MSTGQCREYVDYCLRSAARAILHEGVRREKEEKKQEFYGGRKPLGVGVGYDKEAVERKTNGGAHISHTGRSHRLGIGRSASKYVNMSRGGC